MTPMTLAAAFFVGWNPIVQFLCAALIISSMIWGLVWSGIRLWHKRQVKELASQITPLLTELKDSIGKQDDVLDRVRHEVELNNGSSIKDSVRRIEENQENTRLALVRSNEEIRRDLDSNQRWTANTLEKVGDDIKTIQIEQAKHLGVHEGMTAALKAASA
jgi:hypothetical protein